MIRWVTIDGWLSPLTCLCLAALIAFGCSADNGRRPADGSTITVLFQGSEYNWKHRLVFLQLTLPNEKGELEGRLAKSWEHSSDYRTWTFHLRTDVRWHDGLPVTAQDVKFTLDLLSHPDVLFEAPDAYTVTILDDSTFSITHHKTSYDPYFRFTEIYPKHLLEDLDPAAFRSWQFWTHPVGDGPYRYVRHVPKTMMEFEANPDYYRGKPKIERLVLKFGESNVTELLSGNVDAIYSFNRIDVPKVAGDPRFRVYYEIWDDVTFLLSILWNQHNLLFRDPVVRRALTLAINRRELHRVLNMSETLPVLDVVFTERQYWQGELPEPVPFDPAEAEQLLDVTGWRDVDGDGIRERDGEEFSFSLLVLPKWQGAAVYVQDLLRRVGVEADVITLEGAVLFRRVVSGEFDAAIATFWTGIPGDDGLRGIFGENSPIGYHNSRVLELLDAGEHTMHPDEMDAIYRELMSIFQAELPFTYLVLDVETYVAHRRIKGLSTPFHANPLRRLEHLWIEDDG